MGSAIFFSISNLLTIDIQHHLPLRWAYALMESEPHLSASAQFALGVELSMLWGGLLRRVVGRREERAADWGVLQGGQMTQDDVHRLHSFEWDLENLRLWQEDVN